MADGDAEWFEPGQTAVERLTAFARAHPGEVDPALMGFAKLADREEEGEER